MLDFLQNRNANRGADRAADAIEQGNQRGIDAINGFYDQSRGDLNPYLGLGQNGVNGLNALMGGDYSGFYDSPDYQSARDAMTYAGDHSAAAKGRLYANGYQADLSQAQGNLANQYLGGYRNSLMGMAGLGQQSAMGLGQLGAQAGNNIAGLYSDSGAARAGYHSAYANNTNGMLGGIGNGLAALFGMGG